MRIITLSFYLLLTSFAHGEVCIHPAVPADNHGVASLASEGEAIVVYANDPCSTKNFGKNFDHGPTGNGREVSVVEYSIYPYHKGEVCPGRLGNSDRAYEACWLKNPNQLIVNRQSVKFSPDPNSGNVIVDIKQEGKGPLSQLFSIQRKDIFDARGEYVIEECLPESCRSYTFNQSPLPGRDIILTVRRRPDGTIETRFIVNVGEESHVSAISRANRDLQRRAYYSTHEKMDVYAELGNGRPELRQCFPDEE